MNISRSLTMAIAAGALTIAMAPAKAQVLTLPTQTFSGTTDFSGTFNFAQFNTGLGVLQSVEIDLTSGFSTVVTVTNSAQSASSGSVFAQVQDGLSDGLWSNFGNTLTLTGGTISVQDVLNAPSQAYSLAPGGSVVLPTITKSSFASTTSSAPATLAAFTGAGTIGINYLTITQTFLGNTGGNTAAGQVTTAHVDAKIIYRYDSSVPEPGSAALLIGMGVTGAGIAVRMRKRSKA